MATKKGTIKSVSAPRRSERVDLMEMEALADFMSKHGLEEFEYEYAGLRVRLRKAAGSARTFLRSPAPPEMVMAAPENLPHEAPAVPSAPATPKASAPESGGAEDLHIIKSPIVGTYYSAPSPGADVFVKVGDPVQSGQVLCIIEAMKLMNEIESDTDGELARIFVENGQAVEYGESLFGIRQRRKQ